MLLSELIGKEIVDLSQGVKWGPLRDADLVLNIRGGCVEALVIPVRRGWRGRGELVIPWERVVKVGQDVIVVDLASPSGDGISPAVTGRLRAKAARRLVRRESVDGGNGHWRL